jgi:hypothetical protein
MIRPMFIKECDGQVIAQQEMEEKLRQKSLSVRA